LLGPETWCLYTDPTKANAASIFFCSANKFITTIGKLKNTEVISDGINVIVQKSIEARIQGILQC